MEVVHSVVNTCYSTYHATVKNRLNSVCYMLSVEEAGERITECI